MVSGGVSDWKYFLTSSTYIHLPNTSIQFFLAVSMLSTLASLLARLNKQYSVCKLALEVLVSEFFGL